MSASEIHSSAVIHPEARLGEGVQIGPGVVIERDVSIGDGCVLGPYAVVRRYTTLAEGCRVHAHAVLGDLPQDLSFKDEPSYLRVGQKCVIREGVTLHRGTKAETVTEIGNNGYLMVGSHVGHNCKLGNNVILVNNVLLAGYVEVGDNVIISGHSVVHQFTRIGRLSMMAGCSGISKDCPPFRMVPPYGVSTVSGLNVIGLRRAGIGPEQRAAIKKAFGIVYRSGLNVSQAVDRLKAEPFEGPVREFIEFIESSKRGLCRFGRGTEEEEEG